MIVLGSTGSIGVNTLEIAKRFHLNVEILVAGNNISLLNEQLKIFKPKVVIIADVNNVSKINHTNVKAGADAILQAIEESDSQLVVNALVGFVGLAPTLKAIQCGKKLALANKESLVVAGKFIDTKNIIPIDSEHFALWYLYDTTKTIDSLTITASGGSFRDFPLDKLKDVTIKEALNHPNWSMGNKITIDSATMTNKLFELLEAKYLFNTKKCDAIIETKSIIHGMINYKDGSTTAHMAGVSMQLPISYAIMDTVDTSILQKVDLLKVGSLEFREIQTNRYPIWELKDQLLDNDNLGVVINAANEIAVASFLQGDIGFLQIAEISKKAINQFHNIQLESLEHIFDMDKEIRAYTKGLL